MADTTKKKRTPKTTLTRARVKRPTEAKAPRAPSRNGKDTGTVRSGQRPGARAISTEVDAALEEGTQAATSGSHLNMPASSELSRKRTLVEQCMSVPSFRAAVISRLIRRMR